MPGVAVAPLLAVGPVRRAPIAARPASGPGLGAIPVRHGAALDLDRSFSLDDARADLRHFLAEAGFLHLRGVFAADEVARLSAETDRWRARMTDDDTLDG